MGVKTFRVRPRHVLVALAILLSAIIVILLTVGVTAKPVNTKKPLPTVTQVTTVTITPKTKTITVTKTKSVIGKTDKTNINTHGMDITWGCHPTRGCHYGVTDLETCHVWIQAPSAYLQSVLDHEFIHVLQCKDRWWYGKDSTEIERVADAGALMLGATWVGYTNTPTPWEKQQASNLLGLG